MYIYPDNLLDSLKLALFFFCLPLLSHKQTLHTKDVKQKGQKTLVFFIHANRVFFMNLYHRRSFPKVQF